MIEKTVNGVTHGFRFGTYTFKILSELTGEDMEIEDVFDALSNKSVRFVSTFYYACAKHYAISKTGQCDFSEVHIADWLDELGFEGGQEIFQALIKAYQLKNQKAPETGHAEVHA